MGRLLEIRDLHIWFGATEAVQAISAGGGRYRRCLTGHEQPVAMLETERPATLPSVGVNLCN